MGYLDDQISFLKLFLNKMRRNSLMVLTVLVLSIGPLTLIAQDSEYSLRGSVNIEAKIIKNLKAELAPEYRFNPVSGTSILIAQAGLNYRFASWLSVGGYYRLKGETSENTEVIDGSSLELSNRFAFDANMKIDLKRFTPKFRIRFCNFSDFDSQTDDKSNFLRYRFGLDYNIKGIKLSPFASVELFQKLSSGLFSKTRYTLGAEYDLSKSNSLSLSYSFDDKFTTSNNYHLFELTYKIKF
jgi:hypothetical protein